MDNGTVTLNAGRVEFLGASASSFSTRERQAADIFSDAGYDDIFPFSNTDDTTDLCRHLEKNMIKEMRLWWDISTLENYLKVGRIPRGLRIRKFPAFSDISKDFVEAWNSTLSACSSRLMELIIDFHTKKHSLIQSDIKEVQLELLKYEAKVDTAELLGEIKQRVNKCETEVKRIKREKFLRDKRDYELNRVYDWNIKSSFASFRSKSFNRKNNKGASVQEKKVRFRNDDEYLSEGAASSSSFLYTEGEFSMSDSEEDNRRSDRRDHGGIPIDRDRVKTRSQPGPIDPRGLDPYKKKALSGPIDPRGPETHNKKKHGNKRN
ncbi:hypothetical protein XELAEV_18003898mg [Xenopus laevis]|uniref:Uncharacterized protein n=1 Tax=Xenopus laevis TaxID=8355 RepID=A0A974H017_XENLA|nr:hypothetical protein XELAEV_18003898mg [Xenopus laevis]